jgi:hypothetical protein
VSKIALRALALQDAGTTGRQKISARRSVWPLAVDGETERESSPQALGAGRTIITTRKRFGSGDLRGLQSRPAPG